jgi:hypothetical protein
VYDQVRRRRRGAEASFGLFFEPFGRPLFFAEAGSAALVPGKGMTWVARASPPPPTPKTAAWAIRSGRAASSRSRKTRRQLLRVAAGHLRGLETILLGGLS